MYSEVENQLLLLRLLLQYFYHISCHLYMIILSRLYLLCYLPSSFQTAFFSSAVKLNRHIFSTQWQQQHGCICFDRDLHINYSNSHIYTHNDKNNNSDLIPSTPLIGRECLLRSEVFICASTSGNMSCEWYIHVWIWIYLVKRRLLILISTKVRCAEMEQYHQSTATARI